MNDEIIEQIVSVMNDGARIDRYLEFGSDGMLFLTTKNEFSRQLVIPHYDTSRGDEDRRDALELLQIALSQLRPSAE